MEVERGGGGRGVSIDVTEETLVLRREAWELSRMVYLFKISFLNYKRKLHIQKFILAANQFHCSPPVLQAVSHRNLNNFKIGFDEKWGPDFSFATSGDALGWVWVTVSHTGYCTGFISLARLRFLYRQYINFLYFNLYLNTVYAAHKIFISLIVVGW